MWHSYQRWQGIILSAIVIVASLWLALTNQLILYIHPRYVLFTVAFAIIGLVFVVASFVTKAPHSHEERPTSWKRALSVSGAVLTLVLAAAMIVIPPKTLTSATVAQREINATAAGPEVQSLADASSAPSSAFASFTVLDWSSLLRQTSDLAFYEDKPVDVVGFVTADPDDPANVFYVSRFVVTCCAIDAQPVGVPVYLPGWEAQFALDDWVRVTGEFTTNPSSGSMQEIALLPEQATITEQPSEPYLF